MGRKAAAAVVEKAAAAVQDCGINFWTLDEKTWWYLGGLLAVQVISREVLKRWGGAFKSDAALVAHQICSLLCILHCSVWGCYYWVWEAGTVSDRLYGATEGAVFIGRVNLTFQLYDLVVSLLVARLRKIEMVLHHIFSAALAFLLLQNCYVHWYAIFYLGISEISSIPLTVMDVFKFFPSVAERFPTLNSLLRVSFAVLFITIRAIYWPVISARHVWDTFGSIRDGTVRDPFLVCFFMTGNVLLTTLQWYWAYLIARAAMKMLSGQSKKKDEVQGASGMDSKGKKKTT